MAQTNYLTWQPTYQCQFCFVQKRLRLEYHLGRVKWLRVPFCNQVTEIHRPNGVSTYNTYNARDQITDMKNICDDCEWTISEYHYTYDDRGFIVGEDVTESLYAYDGDGNRIFQLNYNLHTDDDWKGNSGNGNGNNKDNSGSGNSGIAAATGQEARIRKASWRV